MARLTRAKDWSKTFVGDVEHWPPGLRITVSIILNSRFPMFLCWGHEHVCFYNDAFRPVLGINGKHPYILGMRAEEAWPEVWATICPFIQQVMEGRGATWADDHLIPVYRNGQMEDAYWTFSFSQVNDESGKVAAVLLTGRETTDKITAHKKLSGCNGELSNAGELATWELNLETNGGPGKPIKRIGPAKEITEQKKYQENLQETEQKFRLLAELMPQFIWTGDSEGKLNYFNETFYKYTGLTRAQIEKDGWLQIIHPDEKEENNVQWMRSIQTGEDFLFEHRFRSANGGYRWQLSRAIPQKDSTGKIQMWVGASTNIEDQKTFTRKLEKLVQERTKELKQLNEALKKSEERYHLMVEEVQDYAILYLNKNGIVENWNKGAEKIKGYTSREIIGKSFSVFYSPSDQKQGLPGRLLDIAAREGKASQEGWRIRKDGTAFWASVVITAVHDEDNNVIGFSKVTHDLTLKKQADDQLKRTANELEVKNIELQLMNTELQSFAYVSSHDLQEPLRKIQVFATMITQDETEPLSGKAKDYLGRIQNAASRMQTLINDLLTYSRTNITERNFEKTDLNKILDDVKGELKEEIQQKNAIIESDGLCEVPVIPFQFQQLLMNLVGNALKFAKPNTAPLISINARNESPGSLDNPSLKRDTAYCHVSISDNGIGFEPRYSDRIFEVFQRLHGKAEYKGTGIGLAIVKKIVENHNGVIKATGALNQGATFDIYLPIER